MLDLMKIVGISAVLSAGVVMMSEMQVGAHQGTGKAYTDRVPYGDGVSTQAFQIAQAAGQASGSDKSHTWRAAKGDLLRKSPSGACVTQAWPNISPECIEPAGVTPPRSVRMITVEERSGPNTSALVRIPAPEIAQR